MARAVADITLRAGRRGVAEQPRAVLELARCTDRAVLLVHGYNVTETEATASLGRFKAELAQFSRSLEKEIFILTWYGDDGVWRTRPLVYPLMVRAARESGGTLLDLIRSLYDGKHGPRELVIVAHSLGCRVTLEMLEAMHRSGRPSGLERLIVIFMAAAVPVRYLETDGRLEHAVQVPNISIVLHSRSDTVLSMVFGLGQTLAGDGLFPEAVGLRGRPQSGPWYRSRHMLGFKHGDYWSETETVELVCFALGLFVPASRNRRPLALRRLLAQRGLIPD